MMTEIELLESKQEIQTTYLKRVKTFFAKVKTWLPDELQLVDNPTRRIEDSTGQYEGVHSNNMT